MVEVQSHTVNREGWFCGCCRVACTCDQDPGRPPTSPPRETTRLCVSPRGHRDSANARDVTPLESPGDASFGSVIGRVFCILVLVFVAAACDSSGTPPSTTIDSTATTSLGATPETTLPATTTSTDAPAPSVVADIIFTNGVVVTMDPDVGTVEAIAVIGDVILDVGTSEEMLRYHGPSTEVVQLDGRTVNPGFVDAHTHILTDMAGIEAGQALALANGITSLADLSVESEWPERFTAAAESGVLRVRTSMYFGRTDACGVDNGTWYETYAADTVFSDRLRVGGVKIFSDGGVCGLLGVSEPFLEGVEVGDPYHDLETLTSMIREANDRGYQVAIHAQGDLAIARVQDAYAAILTGGENPLRHRIEHNVFATSEVISRYSELGLVLTLFGSSEACNSDLAWTDFYKLYAERPGDIVAANPELVIAWHGDDPWLTPISPISELFSLVTRGRVNEDGTICEPPDWMASGGVTVEQGLKMMTVNSAYAIRQEDVVGSLTPGKFADLVVLSHNLLTVPSDALPDVEVLMTMIGGTVEFCARGAEAWCPNESPAVIPEASASASRSGQGPELAFDGVSTGDSFWSSGGDAPQWIRVDFPEPTAVSGLRFTVFQNPPSDTVHELEVIVEGEWTVVATFSGFTTTGDVLTWEPSSGSHVIEAFRITTLESLSWPEWYEIEIGTAE